MSDGPELLDYISFFEAEPKIRHPDIGWFVGAEFESVRGDDHIWAFVAPDEGAFWFKWWQRGVPRADLSLQGVVKWELECIPGQEHLLIKFHQPGVEYFIVQLKPHISVSCIIQWG
jgi:hypothetical protein